MKRILLVVVLLMVSYAIPAGAAPMVSSFANVRTLSVSVVIGKLTFDPQGNASIDVEKVIRGTPRVGPMPVNRSPDGHISVSDERVIGFVDASNALRWVGRLVAGASLETGVIKLQGFFDFNAHIVTPSIMSLAQLDSALRTGALRQTFDATLAFPDGHGGFRSVPARRFTVDYDAMTSQLGTITGLVVPCVGNPALMGITWGSFELRYSDTCLANTPVAQRDRSLGLDGEFTGLTAAGNIAVRVIPTSPFMTEAEWDVFVRDRDLTSMVNVVRVTLTTGQAWTWRLEESIVDPNGKPHKAGGMSTSMTEDTYDFDDGAKITITPSARIGSPGGNARGMVTAIESGSITKCLFAQRGMATVSCTLTHAPPIWVRR